LLKGRYRDLVTDVRGARLAETPWRANLLVDGAFTLLAALLKREPGIEGILYWAVGAGRVSWDESPPGPTPWATSLVEEVDRVEVTQDAMAFVDERGAEVTRPSPSLGVRVVFEWPDAPVTLREFGLYGGDATEGSGTGTMINNVVHDRIDLEPGQRLTRELRLSLARTATSDGSWIEPPPHWIADAAASVVGGVGDRISGVLSKKGIKTVDALANVDPQGDAGLPRVPLIELRSKARLALRTAVEVNPPPGLHNVTVSKVLTTASADLAHDTGVAETQVVKLREQLSALELALDHRFLGRMTVGTLVGAAS
jgi:hypothetical protein